MGARIVQVAREHDRGQAAMKRLAEVAPEIAHSIYYADLSLLGEMKRVGAEIAAAEPQIDVLINNAGSCVRDPSTNSGWPRANVRVKPHVVFSC